MTTLSLRQTLILVVLFVGTSVSFITLDNRAALDPVKSGLQSLILPVTEAVNGVGDGGGDDGDELAQLKAQRDALLAENALLKSVATEVDQLRAQNGFKERNPDWQPLTADVLVSDPTNLQKFITIDKGSKDGVKVGMAVVNPSFYVGQITEVWEDSARVSLIIDGTQQVGARLLDAQADGVVYGMWQQGGRLEMRHVSRDVAPKEGDVVITSPGGRTQTAGVPGDIRIGVVLGEPTRDPQTDTLTIPIYPDTNFDDLDVVTVILADGA